MSKKVKIEDIAKLAEVSPATVSRALNRHDYVNDKTRRAVMEAAAVLGYVHREPRLDKRYNRFIGVIVGDIRNPFFGSMIYALQEEFQKYGYCVVPFNNEFDSEKEKELYSILSKDCFAGLVLVSSMDTQALKSILEDVDCAVTLTDRVIDGFTGNVVIQDNFQAGYIATKYLIDLGYHEIAFVAGNTNSASSKSRVEGYRKALMNAFLPIDESLIMCGKMSIERGYEAGHAYVDQLESLPRAVIMANDMTAIGFIDACRERGVRIPQDLSIVSFDGIELSGLKSLNLTTVQQPIDEMARAICRLTIKAIEEPGSEQNNRVMLEPTLIVRGSACRNEHSK